MKTKPVHLIFAGEIAGSHSPECFWKVRTFRNIFINRHHNFHFNFSKLNSHLITFVFQPSLWFLQNIKRTSAILVCCTQCMLADNFIPFTILLNLRKEIRFYIFITLFPNHPSVYQTWITF